MNATSSIVIVAIVMMVVVMMIPSIVVIVIAVRAVMMMMVMMPSTVMVIIAVICAGSPRMSAMGQRLPNRAFRAMSVLPPVATGLRTSRIGRFVPEAVIPALD